MSQVQFLYGSKSAYQALSTKSPNTLYFLTDTFEIYKGTDLYTRSYEIFKNSSAVENPKENYLYVFTDTKQLAIFNGSYYQYLTPAVSANIADASIDSIPTVGAVQTIIATLQKAIDTNKADNASNAAAIAANKQALEVLNAGPEVKGSVANAAAEAVAEVVGGADGAFDTLKDIAEWINSDETGAASMKNDITEIKNTLGLTSGTTGGSSSNTSLLKRVNDLEKDLGTLTESVIDGTNTNSMEYRLSQAENDIDKLEARPNGMTISVQNSNGITEHTGKWDLAFKESDQAGYIIVSGIPVRIVELGNYTTKDAFTKGISTVENLFSNYYTKAELANLNFVTTAQLNSEISTLSEKFSDYYTKSEANVNFLTSKHLEPYALKTTTENLKASITEVNNKFSQYYTTVDADSKFLTQNSLNDYVKLSELQESVSNAVGDSLNGYVLEDDLLDTIDGLEKKIKTASENLSKTIYTEKQAVYDEAKAYTDNRINELSTGGSGGGTSATWDPIS